MTIRVTVIFTVNTFKWFKINGIEIGKCARLCTGIYIYLRENVDLFRAIWGQPLKCAKQFGKI